MGEGDGVYYSGSAYSGSRTAGRRSRDSAARRAKKAAVAVVGLSAVGAGAYFGTTLLAGATPGHVPGGPAAQAPVAPSTPPTSTRPAAVPAPSPGPRIGPKSGVRQSALPSPTPPPPPTANPSPPVVSDDQVAAAQVSRLLQASPRPSAGVLGIESGPVTVSRETGTDGSAIRVVAAHYDLTGWWSAGDRGRPVGAARCTRNLPGVPGRAPEPRPTMLMCWRTGPGKSVVTVAVNRHGKPLAAASVDVLDREWGSLG